jgi:hypothetical protein
MVRMIFLWFGLSVIALALAVMSIIDVVKRHTSGWATAGWIALIVVLPFIGSIAYWVARPTSRSEVEQAYLAQTEVNRPR